MATQTGGYLRYNGPLENVLVSNYGHFLRGESKFVDYLTYCAFKDPRAAEEGWEVSDTPFSNEAGERKVEVKRDAVAETPVARRTVSEDRSDFGVKK